MKGVSWVEKVEADLKSELAMIGDADSQAGWLRFRFLPVVFHMSWIMSQPSQVQLGPHRTAFDKLLKEFKHVKPLLGLICEISYQIHIHLDQMIWY